YVETERERVKRTVPPLPDDRGHRRRIETAGEERADGHVAHQRGRDRVLECLAQRLRGGIEIAGERRRREVWRHCPERLDPGRSVDGRHEPRAGLELRDRGERAPRRGDVAGAEIVADRHTIGGASEETRREKRLRLGGK